MKNPAFRLIIISVNVVLWTSIIVMGLRQLGYQQTYTQYAHPLLEQKPLLIYKPDLSSEDKQVTKIIENNENFITLIDVEYREQAWQLVKPIQKRPYVSSILMPLNTYLLQAKPKAIVLNVRNKQLIHFQKLIDIMAKDPELKVIFTAATTSLLREARKKQPTWLYMAGHTLVSKLQIMGSLFLETMTNLSEDLITINKPSELSERVIKEIVRQKKFLLLNLDSEYELNLQEKNHFYGYISKDINKLIEINKLTKNSPLND